MTERADPPALRWLDRASQAAQARNRFVPATRREALVWIVVAVGFAAIAFDIPRLTRERWIALTWTKVEATVTSVAPGGDREPKRGFPFLVSLEATLPDGRRIATPAPVLLFSPTLDPDAPYRFGARRFRAPQPGQTLPAYVDARGVDEWLPAERTLPVIDLLWLAFLLPTIGAGLWRLCNPPARP